MGFRNPFRVQVDERRRRLRHRLLARLPDAGPVPRAGGDRPGRDRPRSPANYGWPLCYRTDLPYYRWNFNTTHAAGQPAAGPRLRQPRRGARSNTSRWNVEGGPTVEPGLEYGPPITKPDIWYSFQDNNAGDADRDPVLRVLRAEPARHLPAARARAAAPAACGPHGADVYEYDADNPDATKFPPYYDGVVFLGEFTRDYLREVRLDRQDRRVQDQQRRSTAARRSAPRRRRGRSSATTRWTSSSATTGQPLPADVRGRLLRRQPGRGHVPLGLRQGPARAVGRR